MKKNKLAIFDLDGTLFDTKDVNFNAYNRALLNCGFSEKIDYKFYCDYCNGNNYKIFLPQIIKGISKEQLETLHDEKKRLYKSFINMARMNEHLFSFIRLIRCEYAVAVATTASRTNTYEILKEFNVADEFDYIITQEDVRNTKPDPECYELAVKLAEVNKADAVIFEDSETGLKAAEASGINYVRVYGYS